MVLHQELRDKKTLTFRILSLWSANFEEFSKETEVKRKICFDDVR